MTDNIVEAVFSGRKSARTRAIYQYDYGMILKPIGLELPSTYEVHFGTSAASPTVTQLGNADGVLIPGTMLTTGASVYAYIYLHSGEDDGETVYSIVIPVIARGSITDEQPTPVQQDTITQAIAALNSGVETVQEIAEGIPEQIDTALAEAKESGEFDGPPGTTDYTDLTNKPSINNVTLTGNKSLSELGIAAASDIPDVSDFYTKPASGIPASDLAQAVQTSLGKADTALQTAPVSSVNNKTGAVVLTASDVGAGTYSKPSGGIPASDLAAGVIPSVPVQDVQVNGVSVLTDGVANVPVAAENKYGVAQYNSTYGIRITNGYATVQYASNDNIKAGISDYRPIVPTKQDRSVFYGLAKAAGDTTQSASSNAVGSYTDAAKDKIQVMLGLDALIGTHEGATASAAKAAGDVFIYNGKLYKATTAISSGAAIVPGTNCTQTTIIDLLRGA